MGEPMPAHFVRPDVVQAARAASPIEVTWAWQDQAQSTVVWTFHNTGTAPATCVLLRNGYYFAGAFWPVYLNNPSFGIGWASTPLAPLVDKGVGSNTAPVGVVEFADGNRQVMFLFTLAPGQTWSMIEGGFSAQSPPVFQAAPLVTLVGQKELCIGYDPQQVSDWDSQTGTSLQGYSPNPSTISTVLMTLDTAAPDIRLYPGDSATDGPCGGSSPSPSPTPTPSPPSDPCVHHLTQAEIALEAGDIPGALEDVLAWIWCEIDAGALDLRAVLRQVLARARRL